MATEKEKDASDSQYLQSRDFVPQHLLGLVKVSQHDVSLSVMDHSQLPQVALVPLGKVLFVGPKHIDLASTNACNGQRSQH